MAKFDPRLDSEIARLLSEGCSRRSIARELRKDRTTVRRALRRLGVAPGINPGKPPCEPAERALLEDLRAALRARGGQP